MSDDLSTVHQWSRESVPFRWHLACGYWDWPRDALRQQMRRLANGSRIPKVEFYGKSQNEEWLVEVRTATRLRAMAARIVASSLH
eukprot:729526-Prymnesium_polylepis.1